MALAAACFALAALAAHAQAPAGDSFATLFPPDPQEPGTAPGVTVLSRARPAYDPLGLRLGLLAARPRLDLGLGYDSNPTGLAHGAGGFVAEAAPSVALGAGRDGNSIGVFLGLDTRQVAGVPAADSTDGTAAAGVQLAPGADRLRLAVAERQLHEDGSEIGALPTDRPLPYRITTLTAAWRLSWSRLSLTPAFDLSAWRYGAATLAGVSLSERDRDRNVVQAGVTARYALTPQTGFILVLRGADTRYVAPDPGTPSRDSTGAEVLAGIDAGADALLHLRLLLGWEERRFAAAQYGPHAAPIAEGQLVWQPSGMTTVTATLARRMEDAAQEGVAGFTETDAGLRIDREAWRNLLLSVEGGVQQASFTNGGGSETGTRVGASATWLLNRHLRLIAAETLTVLNGAVGPTGSGAGRVTRSLSLLTLGVGL